MFIWEGLGKDLTSKEIEPGLGVSGPGFVGVREVPELAWDISIIKRVWGDLSEGQGEWVCRVLTVSGADLGVSPSLWGLTPSSWILEDSGWHLPVLWEYFLECPHTFEDRKVFCVHGCDTKHGLVGIISGEHFVLVMLQCLFVQAEGTLVFLTDILPGNNQKAARAAGRVGCRV